MTRHSMLLLLAAAGAMLSSATAGIFILAAWTEPGAAVATVAVLAVAAAVGCLLLMEGLAAGEAVLRYREEEAAIPSREPPPAPRVPADLEETLRGLLAAIEQVGSGTQSALNYAFALREDAAGVAVHLAKTENERDLLRAGAARAIAARRSIASHLRAWEEDRKPELEEYAPLRHLAEQLDLEAEIGGMVRSGAPAVAAGHRVAEHQRVEEEDQEDDVGGQRRPVEVR